ncbi:MAG: hypothetical protein JWP44_49 [Mucilaginibacter sp.]|nr:hypothetical protein [Mucilaginibacter sp.]
MQCVLSQPRVHMEQWFILLLQHGVLAVLAEVKVKDTVENNITIVMKRKRLMISKFLSFNNW